MNVSLSSALASVGAILISGVLAEPPARADGGLVDLSLFASSLMPGHDRLAHNRPDGGTYYTIVPSRADQYPSSVRFFRNLVLSMVKDPTRLSAVTNPTSCAGEPPPGSWLCCAIQTPSLACHARLYGAQPPDSVDTDPERGFLNVSRQISKLYLLAAEVARSTRLVALADMPRLPPDTIYYHWSLSDNVGLPILISSMYVENGDFLHPKYLFTELSGDLLWRVAGTLNTLVPYFRQDQNRANDGSGYLCSRGIVTRSNGGPGIAEVQIGGNTLVDGSTIKKDLGTLTPAGDEPFGPFSVYMSVSPSGWFFRGERVAGANLAWFPGSGIASLFHAMDAAQIPVDEACFPSAGTWLETGGRVNSEEPAEFVWGALLIQRIWYGEGLNALPVPAFPN